MVKEGVNRKMDIYGRFNDNKWKYVGRAKMVRKVIIITGAKMVRGVRRAKGEERKMRWK